MHTTPDRVVRAAPVAIEPGEAPVGPATGLVSADFLRTARRARGLTIAAVAEQVGVHKSTVMRWERRERSPSAQQLAQLGDMLAVGREVLVHFFDVNRPGPSGPGPARGFGLRPMRRAAGVPVRQLAAELQINPARVYGWEVGEFRIPRRHLPKIAAVLGLPVEELDRRLRQFRAVVPSDPAPPSALRALRPAGVTLAKAAARAGVHPQTLRRWERGTATPPSWALRRLAAAYEVPTSLVARSVDAKPHRLLHPQNWEAGDFGDVIKTLREWHRLSQPQLAAAVHRHVSAVERWEAGTTLPGAEVMLRLERVLDLPFGALRSITWSRRSTGG